MSKKLTKKELSKLEIDVNDFGVSIWITEQVVIAGKKRKLKHWVLDASNIKKDGRIAFGETLAGQTNAIVNESEKVLELKRV